jgi:hypothetical protein
MYEGFSVAISEGVYAKTVSVCQAGRSLSEYMRHISELITVEQSDISSQT